MQTSQTSTPRGSFGAGHFQGLHPQKFSCDVEIAVLMRTAGQPDQHPSRPSFASDNLWGYIYETIIWFEIAVLMRIAAQPDQHPSGPSFGCFGHLRGYIYKTIM